MMPTLRLAAVHLCLLRPRIGCVVAWPTMAAMRATLVLLSMLALAGLSGPVYAGAQAEEPLADSVRTVLSAAIGRSAPSLTYADEAQAQQCRQWARSLEARLLKRKPEELVRHEFLEMVCYEARRAGLEPSLVLGLIQVESGFRKYAISPVGARGYMQVMPFWSRLIGNGDTSSLFHTQTNLRFGCVILRHYLDREKGNLFMALGRYNGSRGRAEYPTLVQGAWRSWKAADAVLALGPGGSGHGLTVPDARYAEGTSRRPGAAVGSFGEPAPWSTGPR